MPGLPDDPHPAEVAWCDFRGVELRVNCTHAVCIWPAPGLPGTPDGFPPGNAHPSSPSSSATRRPVWSRTSSLPWSAVPECPQPEFMRAARSPPHAPGTTAAVGVPPACPDASRRHRDLPSPSAGGRLWASRCLDASKRTGETQRPGGVRPCAPAAAVLPPYWGATP